MDENRPESRGGLLGPRRPGKSPSFTPLRLTLMPTGLSLDLMKPDQVVGRHTQADVRLPLADVSRRHCRFTFSDGRWHVLDLGSTNGTFVNDERVTRAALEHGDLVRIGGFTFEVQFLPAGAAPVANDVPGPRVPDQLRTINQEQRRKAS